MQNPRSIGIDFGTSNSAMAVCDRGGGTVSLVMFQHGDYQTPNYPSVIFVPNEPDGQQFSTGNDAWQLYAEHWDNGRLLKSLKHFLTDGTFTGTLISGRKTTLEDLIAMILLGLRAVAEAQFGELGCRATVGRPVRFVGQKTDDDEALALSRLRRAFAIAGFTDIQFCYEPVGAAQTLSSGRDRERLCLIADLGGGTSDFCLLRLPESAGGEIEILAADGVGVAGDAIDGAIILNALCGRLGMGTYYRSELHTEQRTPDWIYHRLATLSRFPSLRTAENLRTLNDLVRLTRGAAGFDDLYHLVSENRGYSLFEFVAQAKMQLSKSFSVTASDETLRCCSPLTFNRDEAAGWVAEPLAEVKSTLLRCLTDASIGPEQIDDVYLTGGSSLFGPMRFLFESIFGADRVKSTDEFGAVVRGLSLVRNGRS